MVEAFSEAVVAASECEYEKYEESNIAFRSALSMILPVSGATMEYTPPSMMKSRLAWKTSAVLMDSKQSH